MSFQSNQTSDDFDVMSNRSQTSNARPKRNQHLSLAQMRGVIQIFNHYFPKKPKKRLNRNEKQERWKSYKQRIYREYGRVINGQFASEKALIKRYSDPLTFLKYKLKRATNLKISDLSPLDQDYYREIGGIPDVNELIRKTYNIDSVEKMTTRVNKRPRLLMETQDTNESTFSQNYYEEIDERNYNNDHNHNRNRNYYPKQNNTKRNVQNLQYINNHNNNDNQFRNNFVDLSTIPPQLSATPKVRNLKKEKTEHSKNIDTALRTLNNKMDIFEQEVLDKKKLETFEITKQKFLSLKNCLNLLLKEEPQLIGFIPGIGSCNEQIENAFYHWLNEHKEILKKEIDFESFIQQIITLKSDVIEWNEFLCKWKLLRIFNDDWCNVWKQIKKDMNIETNTNNLQIIENDENDSKKNENDDL